MMAKYRKKLVVVEAAQWFRSGDHPKVLPFLSDSKDDEHDNLVEVLIDDTAVRRWAPLDDGSFDIKCEDCGDSIQQHGWCWVGDLGHIVCPGDWMVAFSDGSFGILSPDIFKATYEKVGEQ